MEMKYVITIILVGILYFLTTANACSCQPEHPQSKYCKSDYVIIARINRKSINKRNGYDVYKINIKKAYKMTNETNVILKSGLLMTPEHDSLCGISLKIGKLYLISASSNQITICNYVKEYSKMTIVERRGFAGSYKKGCTCDIYPTFHNRHMYQPVGACNWSPFSTCETDYGACVPSRGLLTSKGKPVKCHWRQSPAYNSCISDP